MIRSFLTTCIVLLNLIGGIFGVSDYYGATRISSLNRPIFNVINSSTVQNFLLPDSSGGADIGQSYLPFDHGYINYVSSTAASFGTWCFTSGDCFTSLPSDFSFGTNFGEIHAITSTAFWEQSHLAVSGTVDISSTTAKITLTDEGDGWSTRLVRNENTSTTERYNEVEMLEDENAADLEMSSSQYLDITDANQTGLDIVDDLTFSMWVKFEQLPSTAGNFFSIINKGDAALNQRSYYWYIDNADNKMKIAVSDDGTAGGSHLIVDKANVAFDSSNIGVWTHIAATLDLSSETIEFYINGVATGATRQAGVSIGGALKNNNKDFTIGGRLQNGSPEKFFDGVIDEVAIYNTPFTATQISTLYNSGMGYYHFGTEDNLISVWGFNESTGTNTADRNANGNDLTAINTTDSMWVPGIVPSVFETLVWKSVAETTAGAGGTQTFGGQYGQTRIEGLSVSLNDYGSDLIFENSGIEAARFTNEYLGINTTTPTSYLTLGNMATGDRVYLADFTGVNGGIVFSDDDRPGFDRMTFSIQNQRVVDDLPVFSSFVLGDTYSYFGFFGDGALNWGPGGASAWDTNLYRDSANSLTTDDSLTITNLLTVNGALTYLNSDLDVSGETDLMGSVNFAIDTITTTTTLDNTYHTVLVDASATTVAVNLPTASGNTREYTIKKIDSTNNNVYVVAPGSETVDDNTTTTLHAEYNSVIIQSNGTNWYTIGEHNSACHITLLATTTQPILAADTLQYTQFGEVIDEHCDWGVSGGADFTTTTIPFDGTYLFSYCALADKTSGATNQSLQFAPFNNGTIESGATGLVQITNNDIVREGCWHHAKEHSQGDEITMGIVGDSTYLELVPPPASGEPKFSDTPASFSMVITQIDDDRP